MKRIVIGALLLIPVIAGCQQSETYFYHPDKTVEQAKVDCETCHEALLRATVGGTATVYTDEFETLNLAGDECMLRKGYTLLPKDKLPEGISTLAIHRNLFDHSVAGK